MIMTLLFIRASLSDLALFYYCLLLLPSLLSAMRDAAGVFSFLSGTSGVAPTLSPLWLASSLVSSGHHFPYPRLVFHLAEDLP